jgi:hypothetical protein
MIVAMILATLLFQNEEDLQKRAIPLIEKFRSDRIEDREEAHRELRKMGRDVLPLLRKLGNDRDPEFAARIQAAIRAIDLREALKAEARDTGTVKAATVVEWMSAESGRRIVCGEDMGLANKRIRIAADGLEGGAAYELGVDLLKVVDIAAVPDDVNPKSVALTPAAIAGKRDLKTYSSVEALPRVNEFCRLLITVRNGSPREIQAVLISILSFPQNCLALEGGGKLLLSDYSSSLRKIGKLVEELDTARPAQAIRVSVALVAATSDPSPSIPEPFRSLRLPESTGKNKFAVAAEGFTRLELLAPEGGVRRAPPGASLRVVAEQPYVVELEGATPHPTGLQVDRIALRSDAEADRKASPLLQTRLVLKKGDWTVAGSVPASKEGVSLLLLLRAEAE